MTRIEDVLRSTVGVLDAEGIGCALVGGLAVSVRTEPRFTRDVDLAVAIANDQQAERVVLTLRNRGYVVVSTVEQDASGRLATVRFRPPDEADGGVVVDVLMASSGIEPELVAAAEPVDVFPELRVPVAAPGHLVALKLLSRDEHRPQDAADLLALRHVLTDDERRRAASAVELIRQRGYARGRDLAALLAQLLAS